ncbi:hypothetical protein ATJ88_0097 [Isoptericola jiangsuensis]|uniref:Uncharacterized protein n=1 Tax=Isoptericola jiangsuensis TaxID=548579 RepID=A0A2A9ERG2_9MICO|nr:hypothetical protein [Isoptericola jiangsuensis]PFG41458.1 hypothetical protein ATJ88_0097 [Isoptericola jiangsuensis]
MTVPPATVRRPRSRRRLAVGALALPLLLAWYVTAAGGPGHPVTTVLLAVSAALGAATVATWVPPAGHTWRSVLGCGPCDVVAGATVVAPVLLLTSAPGSASMALVAVVATAIGLYQRRPAAAAACPV